MQVCTRSRNGGSTWARLSRLAVVALAATLSVVEARAATLPPGFDETLVSGGLINPTTMALAPDGRLFVCEQGGTLRVIKGGVLLPTPFVSLPVDSAGERGLLGVAFDPAFATNQFVYVYHTVGGSPAHNRVSRFTAGGDVAAPGSELVILELEPLSGATNHNGGAIHFGPDGKLYVGVGENANSPNAQTLSNRLGKMLRINPDGTIPADNPFNSQATGANQAIWALGLRNPFSFAFQRGTGRMFIDDVGAATWEEIDDGIAGSNYGWPASEGPAGASPNPAFRYPLFVYGHGSSATTGCAISAGTFYDPDTVTFPADYFGKYFFSDLCSGWIRRFDPGSATATDFASGIAEPVGLLVSPAGDLYYLARGGGEVWRISATPAPPIPPAQPASKARFRLYNDVTKEHLFTTDANEYAVLATRGWVQEGAVYRVYASPGTVGSVTTVPLYRLYHEGIRQHLWTTDASEDAVLATRGWTQEGVDGHVLPSALVGVTTPLYRLAYAFLPIHLWTSDKNEYDVLATRGWVQEGVAAYVVP